MGAGLAKQIRDRWPLVYRTYQDCCKKSFSEELLGTCLLIPRDVGKYVANLFGQDDWGTDKRKTDYDALRDALDELKEECRLNQWLSIAIPYGMGCGLAGGNWNIVYKIICDLFEKSRILVVIYKFD